MRRNATRGALSLALALLAAGGVGNAQDDEPRFPTVDVGQVSDEQRAEMDEYLAEAGRFPIEYVVSKFAGHDLVIVGENHQIHENCRFVADLIEPLYRQGEVRLLLSEFVRNRNTARLNELLTAAAWNEQGVLDVMRDWAWPTWGFQEYRDIYQAVWKVNRDREEGAPPFRVVGLDDEWDQYEYAWGGMSRTEKFESQVAREEHLVAVAEREEFAAEAKALVHIGYSHSFTNHGIRFGTVLTRNHGDRVFQIVLHPELPAQRGPAPLTRFLEDRWKEAGTIPVGFDVLGSPLGALRDEECVLWGYFANGRFEELAQGYVFLAPITEQHPTTWIPGFINEAQFERAYAVAQKARWARPGECGVPEELDACLQKCFPGPTED